MFSQVLDAPAKAIAFGTPEGPAPARMARLSTSASAQS